MKCTIINLKLEKKKKREGKKRVNDYNTHEEKGNSLMIHFGYWKGEERRIQVFST